MKHRLTLLIIITTLLCSNCTNHAEYQGNPAIWKQEIIDAEKAFNEMAQSQSIAKAFEEFAAHDGVIKRGNNIIQGKKKIGDYHAAAFEKGTTLTWAPDFVDVSNSGDLGYTYGTYTYTSLDSLGNKVESQGIFHTVWKRQENGEWRFVWD